MMTEAELLLSAAVQAPEPNEPMTETDDCDGPYTFPSPEVRAQLQRTINMWMSQVAETLVCGTGKRP